MDIHVSWRQCREKVTKDILANSTDCLDSCRPKVQLPFPMRSLYRSIEVPPLEIRQARHQLQTRGPGGKAGRLVAVQRAAFGPARDFLCSNSGLSLFLPNPSRQRILGFQYKRVVQEPAMYIDDFVSQIGKAKYSSETVFFLPNFRRTSGLVPGRFNAFDGSTGDPFS